ncbi:unnamed protein product [Auanema sp. JU1783]|nr:unnamed protein product [Auanema sp. JU1783]
MNDTTINNNTLFDTNRLQDSIEHSVLLDVSDNWTLCLGIELAYFLLFIFICWWIHKQGYFKVDQDRITIHHRIHKDMIQNQEKAFIQQQEEILSPMKSLLTQPIMQ